MNENTRQPVEVDANDKLLTAQDVISLLRVGQYKVNSLVRDGQLTAYKIGHRTIRYSASDVQTLINKSRVEPLGGNKGRR